MHRFYVQQELSMGDVSIESLQIVHQLTKVLRIRPGERIIFFNNSGHDYVAEVILYSKESVRVSVLEKIKNVRELAQKIIVHQGMIKKDFFELVLEKGTEVGVFAFRPFIVMRSVKKNFSIERGKKIIREAAEQSGRAILPELFEPESFEHSLDAFEKNNGDVGILFHPVPAKKTIFDLQTEFHSPDIRSIHLFVGPEGGFTDEELAKAGECGIHIVSVLPTTLRSETAGMVFPAIIASCISV